MASPFGSLSPATPDLTGATAPVGPSFADLLRQTWLGRAAEGAVKAAVSGATLPGDVYAGKTPVMDDSGHTAPEVIDRSADLAGTLMGGGLPAAEKDAAGIFGGVLAKTADKNALVKAQAMAKADHYPDEIWDATGWFQGPDQKWRFEIPDTQSFTKGGQAKSASEVADMMGPTVGQSIYHPDLLKAYPELADVKFGGMNAGAGTKGVYRPGDPLYETPESITVSNKLTGDDAHSVALHELQHAVQEREGFAGGADPNTFARGLRSSVKDMQGQVDIINDRLKGAIGTPRYDELLADRSDLVRQIQDIEGPYGIGVQEKAHDQYRRTAGEVEARNVQTRAKWSPDKLRDVPPSFSQDVPYAEQTGTFGRDPVLGAGSPVLPTFGSLAPRAPSDPDVHPMPMLPNRNNFDQMVVPPFGLPPDRNTYMPDDVSSYRGAPSSRKQRGL